MITAKSEHVSHRGMHSIFAAVREDFEFLIEQ